MSTHKLGYKNVGLNSSEMRRRREEEGIQLRKQKRDDELMKRRNVFTDTMENAIENDIEATAPDIDMELSNSNNSSIINAAMIAQLNSDDEAWQLTATKEIRRFLLRDSNAPEDVIKAGVVPKLIQFLSKGHNAGLQWEAVWALTIIINVTAAQIKVVVEAGAVPLLIKLLPSPRYTNTIHLAIRALGIIASDSAECRDHVLDACTLAPLLQVISDHEDRTALARVAAWTISILCREKDSPADFSKVVSGLPGLVRLLSHSDPYVASAICRTINSLNDGTYYKIRAIIDAGAGQKLVALLSSNETNVEFEALRAVSNIVSGGEAKTQLILDWGALPFIYELLTSAKESIRRVASWTLSNILAGNQQTVIDANIIPVLIDILKKSEFRTRKEAAWAIWNATFGTAE